MKNILLVSAVMMLMSTLANAQMVSNIPLKNLSAEYIKLHAGYRAGRKMVVHLDFGQVNEAFNAKDMLLTNDEGLALEFNSMIHALNYLNEQGYELFNIYSAGTDGDMVPFYIMKRKEEKVN